MKFVGFLALFLVITVNPIFSVSYQDIDGDGLTDTLYEPGEGGFTIEWEYCDSIPPHLLTIGYWYGNCGAYYQIYIENETGSLLPLSPQMVGTNSNFSYSYSRPISGPAFPFTSFQPAALVLVKLGKVLTNFQITELKGLDQIGNAEVKGSINPICTYAKISLKRNGVEISSINNFPGGSFSLPLNLSDDVLNIDPISDELSTPNSFNLDVVIEGTGFIFSKSVPIEIDFTTETGDDTYKMLYLLGEGGAAVSFDIFFKMDLVDTYVEVSSPSVTSTGKLYYIHRSFVIADSRAYQPIWGAESFTMGHRIVGPSNQYQIGMPYPIPEPLPIEGHAYFEGHTKRWVNLIDFLGDFEYGIAEATLFYSGLNGPLPGPINDTDVEAPDQIF